MYARNLKAYKRTNLEAEIAVASPHRIISMLYAGLIERLAQAKGAIERKDYEYKADRLSKAKGIIGGLQSSLDRSYSPELYDRMYGLYNFMNRLLDQAAVSMDTAPIDEVVKLILPIKTAWDNIPENIKNDCNAQLRASNGAAA